MDCRTARLLLDYARPHAPELASDDAVALERHLAGCPDCADAAARDHRVDDCLGRAVRAVEVPVGLRQMICNRLDADRADWRRRVWGRVLRYAAAAAVLVAAVWGFLRWRQAQLPRIDPEDVGRDFVERRYSPFTREKVEELFRNRNVDYPLPRGLNYAYLTTYGLADLPGQQGQQLRQVPQLVFIRHDDDPGGVHEHALVYILSRDEFEVVQRRLPPPPDGYSYRVTSFEHPSKRYVYIVIYTGEKDYPWLKRDEPVAP
jgi:hypothetical protein